LWSNWSLTDVLSWVCVRIDIIGGGFSAGLAAYLVYGRGVHEASNIGFSLNMAGKFHLHGVPIADFRLHLTVGFSSMILWWVRILNEVEVSGELLSRVTFSVSN
jgi:hypothetical protein